MSELPYLVKDLALILIVAGVVTIVFKKLKQPLVLGYVVAGFLVSPHMPYTMSVVDRADISTWGDIGVMFLLFSLGLDFSFKKILKMGMTPVIATCSIVFCMMMLGIVTGHAFGWSRMDCIFLGGMLAGALWGAIPGLLKALLNINEVLACIMTNWIAANLVTWMFDISSFKNVTEGTKSGYIYKTTFNGVATPKLGLDQLFPGSQVNAGILVAIILAIVVYIIMEKTVFGYELKACGANRHAARYAGINEKKNVILSMTIAGALAGFGAGLFYLSGGGEWNPLNSTSLPAMGFNGIATALLANSNPIGTIFSSLFISHISVGGAYLPTKYFPSEIADLISGIIIYLCAFSMLFRGKIHALLFKNADKTNVNAEPAAPAKSATEKEGK